MGQPEFKESGAQRLLTKVLNERSRDMRLVRYSAARKLASLLQEEAPGKTADVLLEWLTDKAVVIYNRTDARVEGAGTEATAGRANFEQSLGSDARFMAAQALSWLGDKAAKRPDIVQALCKAAKEENATLRKYAKQALTTLGIKE
jgi:hypothetical protein